MKALGLLLLFVITLSNVRAANIKILNEDDFFPFIDENPNVFVKVLINYFINKKLILYLK